MDGISNMTIFKIISFFVFYPGLIPYRLVYLAAAVVAVPVLVLILMEPGESPGQLKVLPFSAFRNSFVLFFANRKLRATALVDMATYFAFGAFETFLPLVLLSRGLGAYEAGILFAAQTLIIALTKPFFGRIADRVDKRVQIIAGLPENNGRTDFVEIWMGPCQSKEGPESRQKCRRR